MFIRTVRSARGVRKAHSRAFSQVGTILSLNFTLKAAAKPSHTKVFKDTYKDSIELMRLSAELKAFNGVRNAAVMIGTPANLELLQNAGLITVGLYVHTFNIE